MTGPKNSILDQWGSTALRAVELPSGMRALLKLPDVNELVLKDSLPRDLREIAFSYAKDGIEISKLDSDDLKRFIQFTYELTARMVKYLAAAGSDAWEQFRETGGVPSDYGWEPVTLTAQQLRELDVDPLDLAALGQIAGRVKTPNEVTAMSRFDRGILAGAAPAEAVEPGQKIGDFATFREEPGSDDARPDSEDVRGPAVRAATGGRPGSRARGRRSDRA